MSDNNWRKRWLVIALMGMIVLPIAATLVMASYKVVSTAVPMVWGSWSSHQSRLQREEDRVAKIRQAGYDEYYQNVCPEYFKASFFGRLWTYRTLSWCEDYRDRMPAGS
ncbi:hypothetical protein [Shinella zoogloeoides]|uniref:hypothetical protein n=1 Tax=Shinella zoogloeoides TaxID=352475 RepID=UPI0028AC1481|nr:hypothetical protein [Shinella zoogloeoides]